MPSYLYFVKKEEKKEKAAGKTKPILLLQAMKYRLKPSST